MNRIPLALILALLAGSAAAQETAPDPEAAPQAPFVASLPADIAGVPGTWDLSRDGSTRRCVMTLSGESGRRAGACPSPPAADGRCPSFPEWRDGCSRTETSGSWTRMCVRCFSLPGGPMPGASSRRGRGRRKLQPRAAPNHRDDAADRGGADESGSGQRRAGHAGPRRSAGGDRRDGRRPAPRNLRPRPLPRTGCLPHRTDGGRPARRRCVSSTRAATVACRSSIRCPGASTRAASP